jgi:hypothetical protein
MHTAVLYPRLNKKNVGEGKSNERKGRVEGHKERDIRRETEGKVCVL